MNILPRHVLKQSPRALAFQLTFILLMLNAAIGLYLNTHPAPVRERAAPMLIYTDAWTESLTWDAAAGYRRHGFFRNAGLPTISNEWLKRIYFPQAAVAPAEAHVYLHEPGTPYLLAGAGAILFGADNAFALRIIPLGVNALLFFVFLNGVFSVIGEARQRFQFLACLAAIPVGWAQMYGMANINYAHFVLLALVGVLLPMLHAGQPPLRKRQFMAVAGIGFLGGCFTFDYFFVMLLTPLAVACLYHGEYVFRKGAWRTTTFWLCVSCVAGFGFAHALHLLQVAAYYGSLNDAMAEMWSVARYRSGGNCAQYRFLTGVSYCPPKDIVSQSPIWGRLVVIGDYFFIRSAFDSAGRPVLIAPFYLHVFWAWKCAAHWWSAVLKSRFVTAIAVAVAACMLWPMVMPNHAAIHTFFIPHHFYLVYLLLVLLMTDTHLASSRAAEH